MRGRRRGWGRGPHRGWMGHRFLIVVVLNFDLYEFFLSEFYFGYLTVNVNLVYKLLLLCPWIDTIMCLLYIKL